MENLNAEQVKKALECCVTDSCISCPYDDVGVYSQCVPTLLENALALINSQEQRIKELTEENEKIGIENFDLICELSRIKADTVQKFADRAEKKICETVNAPTPSESYIVEKCIEAIYQIAKEMVEAVYEQK